jgi:ankyrin repeat protein
VAIAFGGDSSDALFQAVRNNDLAFLKAQFAKGADVNSRDRRESTLLMHAAAFGSPEAVKLLLDSGADVNARNSLGATALLWGADNPPIAKLLVDKGADVNAASTKGKRTPLMVAARCDGCSETVSLLLSKGADPKAKAKQGETALQIATDANDLDTMRLLLAKGAEPDAADETGTTPLQLAASNCSLPAINMLLSRGARVNSVNTSGGHVKFGPIQLIHVTSLMWAAPYCSSEVIKTLLDAGADVNVKDVRQMNALMLAVASERQDVAVVRLLLKAGADVNVKSAMGETAFDWARKFGGPAADAHSSHREQQCAIAADQHGILQAKRLRRMPSPALHRHGRLRSQGKGSTHR